MRTTVEQRRSGDRWAVSVGLDLLVVVTLGTIVQWGWRSSRHGCVILDGVVCLGLDYDVVCCDLLESMCIEGGVK